MENLYPAEQRALAEQTAAQRLATLARVDQSAGPVFMRTYANALLPTACAGQRHASASGAGSDQDAVGRHHALAAGRPSGRPALRGHQAS
jgi:aminopeptidase N